MDKPTPFLISHHAAENHHRCVPIGKWMVCARCLGLYPLLFALIGAQTALRAPTILPGDAFVALVLPLPALLDWARGRFNSRTGSNALRIATGLLLGVGLARTLYLHMREPFHRLAVLQLGLLLLAAAGVELAARLRPRPPVDPNAPPDVEDGKEAGSGD
ncbi:MAG: DUF2085 domain-containing protein [Myxococcales bacterium]|jgi:uncharacterized membrane protein